MNEHHSQNVHNLIEQGKSPSEIRASLILTGLTEMQADELLQPHVTKPVAQNQETVSQVIVPTQRIKTIALLIQLSSIVPILMLVGVIVAPLVFHEASSTTLWWEWIPTVIGGVAFGLTAFVALTIGRGLSALDRQSLTAAYVYLLGSGLHSIYNLSNGVGNDIVYLLFVVNCVLAELLYLDRNTFTQTVNTRIVIITALTILLSFVASEVAQYL